MNRAYQGTIIAVRSIAARTVVVTLGVPDNFTFHAGQYLWLMLPILQYPDPAGNTRMFSIISSPNERGGVEVLFRTGESGYKKTLASMTAGSTVTFSGPYGSVALPEDTSLPLVFVAGGVGVASFLSMIRQSTEMASGHQIILLHANPSEAEIVYRDDLARWERENPNLLIVPVIGELKENILQEFIGKKVRWFVSGPRGLVNSIGTFLSLNHVPLPDVSFEQFYPDIDSQPVFAKILEERRLGIAQHPYELAVESSNNHIVITDTNGVILYANRAAQESTGYTLEEMKGNTPRLWGGCMPPDFYATLWKTIKYNRKPFHGEVTNRRKNQDEYYALAHISPILDTSNELMGFVATEEDITPLKELDIAKTEFISIASHQLRAPITGLNWLVEGLQFHAGNFNEQQKKYVSDLAALAKRMTDLIEDLLNFSRVEMGTARTKEVTTFDVQEFLDEFEGEFSSYAASRQHVIAYLHDTRDPVMVTTNRRALYNILQNLTSNAVDYSPKQSTVTVRLERVDGFARVSVTNTGSVIPKDEQPYIFQKFYRGARARKIKPDGTGLGLYVAKAFIEDIGGAIGFTSEEGSHTVFWFTVPLSV